MSKINSRIKSVEKEVEQLKITTEALSSAQDKANEEREVLKNDVASINKKLKDSTTTYKESVFAELANQKGRENNIIVHGLTETAEKDATAIYHHDKAALVDTY